MTVRVQGLRELDRALKQSDAGLRKMMRADLKEAARPVSDEAQQRLGRIRASARTTSGIRPRVRSAGVVVVEQSRRKTTGKRGDWGAYQMRAILIPALAARTGEVVHRLETMLDRLHGRAGLT